MKLYNSNFFSDNHIGKYVNGIIRYRYWILAVSIALFCVAFMVDLKIGINSSLMALLPQDTPSITRVKDLEKKTGGFGDLIVMIESPDKLANIKYAESILPQIRNFSWTESAGYKLNDSVFSVNKLLYINTEDLEEIRDRTKNFVTKKQQNYNPLFVDLMDDEQPDLDFSDIENKYSGTANYKRINSNNDSTVLLLVIHPRGITSNISFAKSIYDDLSIFVNNSNPSTFHNSMKVSIGGTYKNRIDEYNTILHDVASGFLFGALAILILLLIYFRRISLVIAVLFPLLLSLSLTFAISEISIGDLNLITAFLIVILFGLGIDFGIHLLSRYIGMRKNGDDHITSLTCALQNGGKASLIAALTTVASFYFLMFSDFLGFRHFGFIAGTGVLVAYIAYMTVFPALITILDDFCNGFKLKPSKNDLKSVDQSPLVVPVAYSQKHKGLCFTILILILSITIICLCFISRVSFEYDFRNLRSQVTTTREFNQKMRSVFKEARDPAAIIVKDATEGAKVTQYIKDKHLIGIESPIEDVKSIADIMPSDQERKLKVIKEIRTLIDSNKVFASDDQKNQIDLMANLLVDSPMTINQLPPEISKLFAGLPGTYGQLIYVYQRNSLLDLRTAKEFSKAVGKMDIDGKTYNAISEPIVFVDLITILEHDSAIAVIGTFLVILLIIIIHFRKLESTVLVMIPIITGMVWMLGIMGMLGIKLNMFNLVILPGIIGLGIDSSVHIYHRFQEKGSLSMHTLLAETGSASILSTLTTLVGFGGLLTANHPGLRSIGIVAIIGLSTCLASSLLFFPSLMSLIKRDT